MYNDQVVEAIAVEVHHVDARVPVVGRVREMLVGGLEFPPILQGEEVLGNQSLVNGGARACALAGVGE